MIVNNPQISAQVMEAMGEPGPFLMLGTMNDEDIRAYQYALDNPANVKAVIPVAFSGTNEFTNYQTFYNVAQRFVPVGKSFDSPLLIPVTVCVCVHVYVFVCVCCLVMFVVSSWR